MTTSYRDPEFLRSHIASIISFYHPTCIDKELGGYINQLRDDGSVFDSQTKHLVGTCRFIYIYSLASLVLEEPEYRDCAAHGLRFLTDVHRQSDGGFAWVLQGREVEDGARHCYGHAFVMLAAAGAAKAGLDAGKVLAEEVYNLLEERFWEPGAQLYVDLIEEGDWNAIDSYRGQNANMHMCEAMLCAHEATGEERYLDRASCWQRASASTWPPVPMVWCGSTTTPTGLTIGSATRTTPKNLFKPYGYLPGHFTEWSKLLLILERLSPSRLDA